MSPLLSNAQSAHGPQLNSSGEIDVQIDGLGGANLGALPLTGFSHRRRPSVFDQAPILITLQAPGSTWRIGLVLISMESLKLNGSNGKEL